MVTAGNNEHRGYHRQRACIIRRARAALCACTALTALAYAITPNATLGVSYSGQFGSGIFDQSARANFKVKV